MIVAMYGPSNGRRAGHSRHEPDTEVGPEERIRLDELLKELDQPDETADRR